MVSHVGRRIRRRDIVSASTSAIDVVQQADLLLRSRPVLRQSVRLVLLLQFADLPTDGTGNRLFLTSVLSGDEAVLTDGVGAVQREGTRSIGGSSVAVLRPTSTAESEIILELRRFRNRVRRRLSELPKQTHSGL